MRFCGAKSVRGDSRRGSEVGWRRLEVSVGSSRVTGRVDCSLRWCFCGVRSVGRPRYDSFVVDQDPPLVVDNCRRMSVRCVVSRLLAAVVLCFQKNNNGFGRGGLARPCPSFEHEEYCIALGKAPVSDGSSDHDQKTESSNQQSTPSPQFLRLLHSPSQDKGAKLLIVL